MNIYLNLRDGAVKIMIETIRRKLVNKKSLKYINKGIGEIESYICVRLLCIYM